MGSKDRKQIAHLCYCFFRCGPPHHEGPFPGTLSGIKEKIAAGLFLCSNEPNEMLSVLKPEWNEKAALPLKEKLSFINFQLSSVFPWKNELSEGIDHEKYCNSFFTQPDLFLRIRPGFEATVWNKLDTENLVTVKARNKNYVQLPNSTKIEERIQVDKEAVIQDYSSQQTGQIIRSEILNQKSEIRLWDCCAGSGGKSIMVYDMNPNINLIVSDKRESILANLKKRFAKAGIRKYKSFVADLSTRFEIRDLKPEIILADVPCTGSGTWGRTPEQLYYFDSRRIEEYASLQKKIVCNVIPHLCPGGLFVYITCSVFKKENEEVIQFIKQKTGLKLKRMETLQGYDKKADSMFIAILTA